jgi:uncharacterized protein YqiB (DUF1249 family)
MSHTLEQTRNNEPMWFFEHNYRYFSELFPEIIELSSGKLIYKDTLKTIKIKCVEVSRYTTLVSLSLTFTACPQIEPIDMTVRLYHDAQLADVVSYQNISPLVAPYFSADKNTAENHKRQANILLYEILSGCAKSGHTKLDSMQTA